jgi:hypothetical protein
MSKDLTRTPDRPSGKGHLSLVQPQRRITSRQEQFCVDIASGMEPSAAFLKNYQWNGDPKYVPREASRVANKPHVLARIEELRNEYAQTVIEASRGAPVKEAAPAFGVKQAMEKLDAAEAVAMEKGNPAALAKIVEVRMKLYGLGIADAKNPGDSELEPEQIDEMLEKLRQWKVANG